MKFKLKEGTPIQAEILKAGTLTEEPYLDLVGLFTSEHIGYDLYLDHIVASSSGQELWVRFGRDGVYATDEDNHYSYSQSKVIDSGSWGYTTDRYSAHMNITSSTVTDDIANSSSLKFSLRRLMPAASLMASWEGFIANHSGDMQWVDGNGYTTSSDTDSMRVLLTTDDIVNYPISMDYTLYGIPATGSVQA